MDFAFHHVVHYILGSFILPNRNFIPSGQHLPISPNPSLLVTILLSALMSLNLSHPTWE